MYDDVTYVYDEQVQRVTCDLNAMNTEEQDRLRREHEGEADIVRYLFGLVVGFRL